MKALISVPVMVFALCTLVSQGGEKKNCKKDEGIKVVVDFLDKTWGIKYKSHTVKDLVLSGGTYVKQVRILFEFTKDVESRKEVQQAFTMFAFPLQGKATVPLWFYCF